MRSERPDCIVFGIFGFRPCNRGLRLSMAHIVVEYLIETRAARHRIIAERAG